MTNERDSDWTESSEGDLDPDLTEEAGYAGWDPPDRSGLSLVYRIVLGGLLLLFVGSAVAVLFR